MRLRYYSAVKSDGVVGTFPNFPVNQTCNIGGAIFWDARFPTTQLAYLSASRLLSWQTKYLQNFRLGPSGGQIGPLRAYLPGERQTQNFLNPLSTASRTVWTWRSGPPQMPGCRPDGPACLAGRRTVRALSSR